MALREGFTSILAKLLGGRVSEAPGGALEAEPDRDKGRVDPGIQGKGELVHVLVEDGLDAVDLDELEAEGRAAGLM